MQSQFQVLLTKSNQLDLVNKVIRQLEEVDSSLFSQNSRFCFVDMDDYLNDKVKVKQSLPTLALIEKEKKSCLDQLHAFQTGLIILEDRIKENESFKNKSVYQMGSFEDTFQLRDLFYYFFKFKCNELNDIKQYQSLFKTSSIEEDMVVSGEEIFNFSTTDVITQEGETFFDYPSHFRKLRKTHSDLELRNIFIESLYENALTRLEKETSLRASRYPYVIYQDGVFLTCNTLYSSLKINYNRDEFLEKNEIVIQQNIYKVVHLSFSENTKIVFLIDTDYKYIPENFSNFIELGIISSSIAHELNNPLASILAFSELLELEVDDNSEMEQIVKDVKKASLKCSQIVNLFLGFGRSSISKDKIGFSEVRRVIFDSRDLLRSRFAEGGLNLNIEFKSLQKTSFQLDDDLLTMFFYLLLDGVFTRLNQSNLIQSRSSGEGNSCQVSCTEDSDEIILLLPISRKGVDNLMENKLVFNLLKTLNLSFSLSAKNPDETLFSLKKV
ncbi:hypothetical protein N9N67_10250 [Bacteriovoracaceae bacterium]|nr:hypothetical protein [Bacteriovoracaceae bacterium]